MQVRQARRVPVPAQSLEQPVWDYAAAGYRALCGLGVPVRRARRASVPAQSLEQAVAVIAREPVGPPRRDRPAVSCTTPESPSERLRRLSESAASRPGSDRFFSVRCWVLPSILLPTLSVLLRTSLHRLYPAEPAHSPGDHADSPVPNRHRSTQPAQQAHALTTRPKDGTRRGTSSLEPQFRSPNPPGGRELLRGPIRREVSPNPMHAMRLAEESWAPGSRQSWAPKSNWIRVIPLLRWPLTMPWDGWIGPIFE